MKEDYRKKQSFQFCEIRNVMVRLDIIQATATMPDLVHAEAKLLPVSCDKMEQCKGAGVKCMVYDSTGADPCPGAWDG